MTTGNQVQCKTCFDDGYLWDSLYACPDCEAGKAIQHRYNFDELKAIEKRARYLRKQIKAYRLRPTTVAVHESSEVAEATSNKRTEALNSGDMLAEGSSCMPRFGR